MAGERYVIPRSDFDALVNLTFGVLSRACSCDKMYGQTVSILSWSAFLMVYKWGCRCLVYVLCERVVWSPDVCLECIPMCVLDCVAPGNTLSDERHELRESLNTPKVDVLYKT